MTDQATNTEEEREPTAAESMQIAKAGAQAIQASDDPAKAQTAAAAAIEAKAEELNVKVSRDDAVMIATATIEALEARGAFGDPDEPSIETREVPQEGANGEHAEHQEHADKGDEKPDDTAPRKRSWAARYLGKGGDE